MCGFTSYLNPLCWFGIGMLRVFDLKRLKLLVSLSVFAFSYLRFEKNRQVRPLGGLCARAHRAGKQAREC